MKIVGERLRELREHEVFSVKNEKAINQTMDV